MKLFRLLICAVGGLALAAQSQAGTLYGSTSAGGPGELYILDAATGAALQDVGPLNDSFGLNYPVTGLAFNPINGLLYGSTGNAVSGTEARLITINPATASVTLIGSFNAGPVNSSGTPATMADIAFDAAGNLFGIGSIGGPQLYSINLGTGQATVIGGTGLTSTSGGGLAISSGNIFYGTPTSSRFGIYNSITGTYTNIANPLKPVGGAYAALAFDDTGILYGLDLGPASGGLVTHLVTINPANAAVTDIGQSITALDAIAFQPIPEPGTMALFIGCGAMGLLINARRRK